MRYLLTCLYGLIWKYFQYCAKIFSINNCSQNDEQRFRFCKLRHWSGHSTHYRNKTTVKSTVFFFFYYYSFDLILCDLQKKESKYFDLSRVYNDLRVRKWWQYSFFLMNYYFKCQIALLYNLNPGLHFSECNKWNQVFESSIWAHLPVGVFFLKLSLLSYEQTTTKKYLREIRVSTSCHQTRQTRMFSSSFAFYHCIGLDVSSQ